MTEIEKSGPELLAAVKALLRVLHTAHGVDQALLDRALEIADIAITKAEGKSL